MSNRTIIAKTRSERTHPPATVTARRQRQRPCDGSLNELAARAGVCHSLAKRAVRLAELDGLFTVQRRPRSGRRHFTNVIRIIGAEWLDWLSKGRRRAYAVNACNRAKPIFAEARGGTK